MDEGISDRAILKPAGEPQGILQGNHNKQMKTKLESNGF